MNEAVKNQRTARQDRPGLRMGLLLGHRAGVRAQGPERRHRPLHLGQEERARVDARLAAQGLSRLARDGGGRLGQARHPARSITRTLIITPRPRPSRSSAASTRSIPKSCASTKSSASRSRSRRCSPASKARARSRSTRCSTASRVATTFREELKKAGVIFLSISEAIREHPELVKKYLGSVVPQRDNYFACLNSAVFSDGTFVYVPEGVRCPMEL